MKTLEQIMKEAVANKTAKVLTADLAKELIGKRIQTIYFGYHGQDGVDEFVIGDVKPEIWEGSGNEGNICIFTADGRNTFIKAHLFNEGAFTCSDSDRFVYYIEVE